MIKNWTLLFLKQGRSLSPSLYIRTFLGLIQMPNFSCPKPNVNALAMSFLQEMMCQEVKNIKICCLRHPMKIIYIIIIVDFVIVLQTNKEVADPDPFPLLHKRESIPLCMKSLNTAPSKTMFLHQKWLLTNFKPQKEKGLHTSPTLVNLKTPLPLPPAEFTKNSYSS